MGRRGEEAAEEARSPGPEIRARTVAWRLAAYAVSLFGLTLVLQAGVALVIPSSVGRLTMWGAAAACLAALVVTWVMMSVVESRTPAAVGLAFGPRLPVDVARGAGFGLLLIGAVVIAMAVPGWVHFLRPAPVDVRILGNLAYVTGLLLVAAFFEELLVRGYAFQLVARAWGPGVAIGSTAVVFAALHGANPGVGWTAMVNTLLAGILLGILYWRTLSLWLVTAAHFTWNWAMGVAVGLPVSGLDVGSPLVQSEVQGPPLWTGGPYGPEGGLLLSAVAVVGIAWAARSRRLSRDPAVLAAGPLVVRGFESVPERDPHVPGRRRRTEPEER